MGWLAVQLYLASQLTEAVSPHEGATRSLTFCKTVHFCKQGNLIRYLSPLQHQQKLSDVCVPRRSYRDHRLELKLEKMRREHAKAMSYGLGSRKADILCKAAAAVKSDPVPC